MFVAKKSLLVGVAVERITSNRRHQKRQTSISVSTTGSIGSRVFAAFKFSNFWLSLGTSNPRDPRRIDLLNKERKKETLSTLNSAYHVASDFYLCRLTP